MLLYALLIGCCVQLHTAQECRSSQFNFANHYNTDKLDLTTPPATVIASFLVQNVRTVSVVSDSGYILVQLVESELQFITTEKFQQYEEHEVQIVIILQMSYECTTGQINGIYRQDLKEANNHAPRFLEELYRAEVPLPLPKQFDVSPYLASGTGVMARDIDLVNNTITFSVSDNDYFTIESHPVPGDVKQYKAILRLREQVLKLVNPVELLVTATDQGVPSKTSQVSVIILPDLSIVYDDPPVFKDNFVNGTVEKDTIVQLELIPGTKTHDVQYSLEGPDSQYFSTSVWTNNSGLDLALVNLEALPREKSFLNVLVVAQRTELQKTSSVVLLSVNSASGPPQAETTVQQVLTILHLEEMTVHHNIYPLTIENCAFTIDTQTPGEYFYVNEQNRSLSSKPFDREDEMLFVELDFPQFWVVLKLNCPNIQVAESFPFLSTTLNRVGPMRNITYSTKHTHLNIIVQDINDNSPEFTYPPNNKLLAFPSARLAQKLLPGQLIKIEASDRDEGYNAVIRYRLALNDHFGIDEATGVIFPLKNALSGDSSITLEIYATDRDGAEDGNTSTMKIRVVRGAEDNFAALTMQDTDPSTFARMVEEMSKDENIELCIMKNVYSSSVESGVSASRLATEQYITQAIVYAFRGDTLLSYSELGSILKSMQNNDTMSLSTLNELFMSQPANSESHQSEATVIYPYIIVAAFCGTLAIAMAAAAIYYRAKSRVHRAVNETDSTSETTSVNSTATNLAKMHNDSSSTPPVEYLAEQNENDPAHNEQLCNAQDGSIDPYSLSITLTTKAQAEKTQYSEEPTDSTQLEKKKCLKFSEHVERIEVFDK